MRQQLLAGDLGRGREARARRAPARRRRCARAGPRSMSTRAPPDSSSMRAGIASGATAERRRQLGHRLRRRAAASPPSSAAAWRRWCRRGAWRRPARSSGRARGAARSRPSRRHRRRAASRARARRWPAAPRRGRRPGSRPGFGAAPYSASAPWASAFMALARSAGSGSEHISAGIGQHQHRPQRRALLAARAACGEATSSRHPTGWSAPRTPRRRAADASALATSITRPPPHATSRRCADLRQQRGGQLGHLPVAHHAAPARCRGRLARWSAGRRRCSSPAAAASRPHPLRRRSCARRRPR